MYVDESGDPGEYNGNNSKHFILSGIIVKDNDWQTSLDRFKKFRLMLKDKYNFLLKTEIHASELIRINKNDNYRKIRKTNRIAILKETANNIPLVFNKSKIINVLLDKNVLKSIDYQETAWKRLIQRYDNFLQKNNDYGIIVSDTTDEKIVRNLIRKMRYFNYIKSKYNDETYNNPIKKILEDLFLRDSQNSYFIQTADVIAHLLYRYEYPKGSLKKFNVEKYFIYFEEILLKEASNKDAFGIVRK